MKFFFFSLKNNKIIKMILYLGVLLFLFLYIFSIPAFSGRKNTHVISYIFMAGLTGFSVVYNFLYNELTFNKTLIIPCVFVVFSFFGTAFFSHNFRIWFSLLLMLVTLFVFYLSFISINNNRIIFYIFIFALLLFGLYFGFHYKDKIIHLQLTSDRIDTFFDNQNAIGFYFSIAYSLSLFCGLFFRKKIELFLIGFAILFLFLGLFTGSRAFLILIAISTIVIAYYRLHNHKLIFLAILGVLFSLFFILINFLPQLAFLKEQFNRTLYTLFGAGNSKVDTSSVQRVEWPKYAFYLGSKNLIIGYGCNGFSIYSGVGTYSHNNFAELVCNFGLIGFILFNMCFFVPYILVFNSKKDDVVVVPILFFLFMVRSLFGVVYFTKETYLVLALMFYFTKDCHWNNLFKKNLMYYEAII